MIGSDVHDQIQPIILFIRVLLKALIILNRDFYLMSRDDIRTYLVRLDYITKRCMNQKIFNE